MCKRIYYLEEVVEKGDVNVDKTEGTEGTGQTDVRGFGTKQFTLQIRGQVHVLWHFSVQVRVRWSKNQSRPDPGQEGSYAGQGNKGLESTATQNGQSTNKQRQY